MERDRRDRRDPRRLGETLQRIRERVGKRKKLSTLYDENHVELLAVDPYTGEGEGIVHEQVAKYRAEFPDGLPTNDDIDPGGA